MKFVTVIPVSGKKFKSSFKSKSKELRGKGSFVVKKKNKWTHVRYPGWINLSFSKGEILVVKVQSKKVDQEWQLLSAFIGYLDRYFKDTVSSISIFYR
ncbi:MAG: hypothetical protein ACP5IO_06860 [Elusimicrobiales bacterium]